MYNYIVCMYKHIYYIHKTINVKLSTPGEYYTREI